MTNEAYVKVYSKGDGKVVSIPISMYLEMLGDGIVVSEGDEGEDNDDEVDDVEYVDPSTDDLAMKNDDEYDDSDDSELFSQTFDETTMRKIELVQDLNTGLILWSETDISYCKCTENEWCKLCEVLEMILNFFDDADYED